MNSLLKYTNERNKMNFDVNKRTILKVKHGSHAYGTNIETSDLDLKGVCIEPLSFHFGFLNRFEQHIQLASKGHEHDLVIYSLKKFAFLASQCNPNIIEVLFVDDKDVMHCDEFGEMLLSNRNKFLSKKAKHTFSGYAHSQLKRIKTHRNWLLNPPKVPPTRSSLGLPEEQKISKSELGAFENLLDKGEIVQLSENALSVYTKEKRYKNLKTEWDQYQNWKNTRNPARAELEAKHGLDTKHAAHLIRLMRMCKEILSTGKVIVKRPDAEELIAIRNGSMKYDDIISMAEKIEQDCNSLYKNCNILPENCNQNLINELVVNMTKSYIDKFG